MARRAAFPQLLTVAVLALFAACPPAVAAGEATFRASYAQGTAADVAAGSPEGKVVGAVAPCDGVADRAVVVGPKGWLQYALHSNISQDDIPGSIEMWVKPLDWDGASRLAATLFVADYDNTGKRERDRGIFRLYTCGRERPPGNGRLTFIAGPYPQDDPRHQVWAQADISGWQRGQWHQVVATWDGVDVALFLDGQQAARSRINIISGGGEDPRFKPSFGESFTVGGAPWGDTGETAVDEISIFARALRPEEISRRFRGRGGSLPPAAGAPTAVPERPTALPLPQATRPPTVDGALAPGEWDDASCTNAFVTILVPEVKLWPSDNVLYCKTVADKLYLGLRSEFHRGQAPTAEASSHSGQVFNDDCFEIFLTTGREPDKQVLQIEVNSKGSLDVYRCRPRSVLVKSTVRAAAAVVRQAWTAEVEVPLAEISASFSGTSPGKLFLQVSRSYKHGTVAERARQQTALAQEPIEEYVGFPWNSDFLAVKHYAELIPAPAEQRVTCRVDAPKLLTQSRLALEGTDPTARRVLQIAWQGLDAPPAETIAVQPDGRFTFEREVPADCTLARVSGGDDLNLRLPLTRRQGLVLKHTVLSFNDTMEVTVDASGVAAPAGGLAVGLSIRNAAGKVLARKSLRPKQAITKEILSLAGLPAGNYTLACAVPQAAPAAGLITAEQTFRIFRGVPGKGMFDDLLEVVPTPWTPVEVKPNAEIGVWGRTYAFGNRFFPEITAQGAPLLAAPPCYEVQLASGTSFRVAEGATQTTERKPAHCTLRTTGGAQGVAIRQTTTIEYDGMMRYDVQVESREPITRLALHVPYLPDRARVFQPSYFRGKFNHYEMDALEVKPGFAWSSEYLEPAVFLTDMHAGLSWFAATDRTWVVDEGRKKIEVTPQGFVIHFVDTNQQAPKALSFTFGLQAFPTKPPRADWREFGRVQGGKWMSVFVPDTVVEKAVDGRVLPDYFTKIMPNLAWGRRLRGLLLPFCNFPRSVEDYPGLEPAVRDRAVQALHESLAQAQAVGIEYVIPYLSPTYATNSIPEWQFYWSNWIALPKHIFDAYGQPCASVANKQWTDFWLYSFEKYVKQYGIKGVFHDMACAYAEEGALNGLGYDRNGVRYPEYPLWQLRDLYKKTYVLHRRLFPDAMSFMNYGVFTPPLHSFADFLLCAERYETRADRSIYDLDGDGNLAPFRGQCSLPYGPKAMHNGWLKYPLAMDEKGPTVHMYGVVLLHDLVQWNINENPEVRRGVHALKQRMGIGTDRDVEFLPYWDNGDKVRPDSTDLAVSCYRRGQKLMAVIVNTRMQQTWRGRVVLDLAKLGIAGVERLELYDPMANTTTPLAPDVSGGTLTLPVEIGPTLFQAVLVN